MNKIKIVLVSALVFALFLVSEFVYIANHPSTLSMYILRLTKTISTAGAVDVGFFVLTEGKITIPADQDYKTTVKNYLNTFPLEYGLSRVYYDLALISYANGQKSLTPRFLEMAILNDPTFSFWYIELANYHLRNNLVAMGGQILSDCIKLSPPRKHCQEYKDTVFASGQPEAVGFLNDSIKSYYDMFGY